MYSRIILILAFACTETLASVPMVSNITAAQHTDGSGILEVTYDLQDDEGDTVLITARASLDNGVTWSLPVLSNFATGDIGMGITPGTGRVFFWDIKNATPGMTTDNLLIRIEADDRPGWLHFFGGDESDCFTAADRTLDGGFIITGYTESSGAGSKDIWLIRLDRDGEELWSRTVGALADDSGNDVVALEDGDFLVTATLESWGLGGKDIFLFRTDSNGVIRWGCNLGGEFNDTGCNAVLASNGDIIVSGTTNIYESDDQYYHSDAYLGRISSTGQILWEKHYDGPGSDGPGIQVGDGTIRLGKVTNGYLLGIQSILGYDYYSTKPWIIKVDETGELIWEDILSFGHSWSWIYLHTMKVLPDESFLLGGNWDYDGWEGAAFLLKRNSGGTGTIWYQEYFPWIQGEQYPPCAYFTSIAASLNDGFMMAGYLREGWPSNLYWPDLMKVTTEGDESWNRIYEEFPYGKAHDIINLENGTSVLFGRSVDYDAFVLKVDHNGNRVDQ